LIQQEETLLSLDADQLEVDEDALLHIDVVDSDCEDFGGLI
jgi:hypothetical protein